MDESESEAFEFCSMCWAYHVLAIGCIRAEESGQLVLPIYSLYREAERSMAEWYVHGSTRSRGSGPMTRDEALKWLQDANDAISIEEFWARMGGEALREGDEVLTVRWCWQQTDPLAGADDARAHAALHAREVADATRGLRAP